MRMIDADALIKSIRAMRVCLVCEVLANGVEAGVDEIIEHIAKYPTIETEPVVRCKDCKWFSYCSYRDCMRWKENDFCSRGERR